MHTSRAVIFLVILLASSVCFNLSAAFKIYENLLQFGITNAIQYILRQETVVDNATYDFIIVGGGAAGCVLANRLSENPKWSVYLIEAGGLENLANLIPILAPFLQVTSANWGYKSVPQKHACFGMYNNECAQPRGKILGGTSSINFMIYNRGNHLDFDRWAAAGCKGWAYKDVLPYFLKSENANLAGLEMSPYHNHSGGPLSVEDVSFRTEFVDSFVLGAQQAGHNKVDYNGASQVGVSYVQANTENGRRDSAFRAFIEPISKERKNLHILTFARVTRVLIDPKTKHAYGVELIHKKTKYTLKARKEVILSAGTFNSPQLLMLSGIGPAEKLRAVGISVLKELPVGTRMYDHMCHFGPTFITNTTLQTTFLTRINPLDIGRFFLGRKNTRLSSIGGVESLAFIKVPQSKEPADFPDIELILVAGSLASDEGTALKNGANFKDNVYNTVYRPLQLSRQDHFSFLIMQFHPKSVGSIWLKSNDPLHWPIIDPNYFSDKEDIEYILAGIKEAIRITKTPAMQRIGTRLHDIPVPGCEQYKFGTDDYWRCSIRTLSYTLHHQVATCRMGAETDGSTVVNSQLMVHGIRKLRVVDTSVIPFPPTAHTNAAAFMIGEKASDMIRAFWENADKDK